MSNPPNSSLSSFHLKSLANSEEKVIIPIEPETNIQPKPIKLHNKKCSKFQKHKKSQKQRQRSKSCSKPKSLKPNKITPKESSKKVKPTHIPLQQWLSQFHKGLQTMFMNQIKSMKDKSLNLDDFTVPYMEPQLDSAIRVIVDKYQLNVKVNKEVRNLAQLMIGLNGNTGSGDMLVQNRGVQLDEMDQFEDFMNSQVPGTPFKGRRMSSLEGLVLPESEQASLVVEEEDYEIETVSVQVVNIVGDPVKVPGMSEMVSDVVKVKGKVPPLAEGMVRKKIQLQLLVEYPRWREVVTIPRDDAEGKAKIQTKPQALSPPPTQPEPTPSGASTNSPSIQSFEIPPTPTTLPPSTPNPPSLVMPTTLNLPHPITQPPLPPPTITTPIIPPGVLPGAQIKPKPKVDKIKKVNKLKDKPMIQNPLQFDEKYLPLKQFLNDIVVQENKVKFEREQEGLMFTCDVCFMADPFRIKEKDDLIYVCTLCFVAVHQECYEEVIPPAYPKKSWTCKRCTMLKLKTKIPRSVMAFNPEMYHVSEKQASKVEGLSEEELKQFICQLCKHTQGLLINFHRPHGQIHLKCLKWNPKLKVEWTANKRRVLDQIDKVERKKCDGCKKDGTVTVQCGVKECRVNTCVGCVKDVRQELKQVICSKHDVSPVPNQAIDEMEGVGQIPKQGWDDGYQIAAASLPITISTSINQTSKYTQASLTQTQQGNIEVHNLTTEESQKVKQVLWR